MTKLDELISNISSEKVYIQTHNFPDPDALASACGLQYLLKLKGIEASICYGGIIDRFNTQKMMELFSIDAVNIDEIDDFYESQIILVDIQYLEENNLYHGKNVIACVDHHIYLGENGYGFSDIREDVGACASIIASYFTENNIPINTDFAELFLYAINMDTANLTRGVSRLDLDTFYGLYMNTDRERINYLENNTIQIDDLPKYVEAINSVYINHNVSFADAGKHCSKSLIATLSDFTSKIEGIYFSVVYSRHTDGIRMSVRSSKKEINSGKIMATVLEGIGTGGGHQSMAGGFVPLENACETQESDKIIEKIEKRMLEIVKKRAGYL